MRTKLQDYTDEELDREVKRRKKIREEAIKTKQSQCDHDWQDVGSEYQKAWRCKKCDLDD